MSLNTYRFADLAFLALLAALAQTVSHLAYFALPHTEFYVSLSLLVSLIAIVRWGFPGIVVLIFSGFPMVFLDSGEGSIFFKSFYYLLSPLSLLLLIPFYHFIRTNKVANNTWSSLVYIFLCFLSFALGKTVVLSFTTSAAFFDIYKTFFASQLLTLVITLLFFILLKKFSRGLIINMNYYIRVSQEEDNHDE